MSNIRQQSPTRSVRRRRERHLRRLGLEALESRACPAVMFDFDGGVLNITGDEGPNVIEIFQPRNRVVEVTGDGERRIFEGVDEVFVDALGGDDTATSSKPKEIVVVGAKINIDAGAGNDRVIINDGGPTRRPAIFNTSLDVAVDLGTGIDDFRMDVRHHDSVNLDLTAEDGNDKILIGMLLPAIQKVRESAARMDLDLGGGGNLVNVSTEGFGRVDLGLLAAGGGNTVQVATEWESVSGGELIIEQSETTAVADIMLLGDGNQVAFNSLGYEQVDLDLDLTGNNNTVEIGLLLPAVQKVRESAARINLDVGGDSLVNVRLENIDNVDLSLVSDPASPEPVTGGVINVYWHVINNGSSSLGRKYPVLILKSSLPGGSAVPRTPGDSPATFSFLATAGGPDAPTSVKAALHLGPEDDTVSVLSRNVDDLQLDLSTGTGDDTVVVEARSKPLFAFTVHDLDRRQFNLAVDLGPGDDYLTIGADGYADVTSSVDAGAGNDRFNGKYLVKGATHRSIGDDSRLSLTATLGDGDDSQEIGAAGFATVNSFIDAGGGNDRVRNRLYVGTLSSIDPSLSQLNVVTLLGTGDDSLEFDTSGYANLSSLIDAGDGGDKVHLRHKMFAIVDRTHLDVVVQLGLGSHTAEIESRGYRDFDTTIDTGPAGDGRDMVATSHVFRPSRGRVSRIPLTLDGGLDTAVFIAEGYDTHDAQQIGDTGTHEVGHWVGL